MSELQLLTEITVEEFGHLQFFFKLFFVQYQNYWSIQNKFVRDVVVKKIKQDKLNFQPLTRDFIEPQ